MGAELIDLVSYRCPKCQAVLQGRPDTWLRCPKCGRASQPTTPAPVPPQRPPEVPTPLAHGITPAPLPEPVNPARPAAAPGAEPASPATYVLAAALARGEVAPPGRDWRILYASGLFVAVTMLVFSTLEGSVTGTSFFGALAFLCVVLLATPGRSKR